MSGRNDENTALIYDGCWQTGVAYDEFRYLKALERRGSPLVKRQKCSNQLD